MEARIAKVFSYLFHPLLMPTYGFLLLFNTNNYIAVFTPLKLKIAIYSVNFIFSFFLPLLSSVILLKNGFIKSLEMGNKEERTIPFLITSVFYYTEYYLMNNFNLPKMISFFILGAVISIVVALIINFKWKISVHMIGIGGVTGILTGISIRMKMNLLLPLSLLILCAGLIGFSRLRLGAHKPTQVYAGFFVGLISELLLFLLLL